MTTYQQWIGRFAIGSSNDSFSIASNAFTLTSGNYYIAGYTSESTAQLCEHITAKIIGTYANAAVTYSETTGLVTFKIANSGTYTITWTDTALQTLLGFTGTQSNAATYTATMEPQHVWRPERGASSYPAQLNQFWAPRSTTVVGRSRDGTTYAVRGNLLYDAEVSYTMLADTRVITPASTGTVTDLQGFFEDVIHVGQPIRVFPDRTLKASTSYVTALVSPGKDGDPIGSWQDFCGRHVANYNGLWDVTLPLLKWVE